jgi:hypothetical protein
MQKEEVQTLKVYKEVFEGLQTLKDSFRKCSPNFLNLLKQSTSTNYTTLETQKFFFENVLKIQFNSTDLQGRSVKVLSSS